MSVEIKKGGKLSIAAACFSIYAFQELKKQLTSMVELFDVVPFTRKHLSGALMNSVPDPAGYAWLLKNVRLIKPFPYKGKLHLYDVDASLVEVLSPIHTKEADQEFEQYYKQLYKEAGAEF